MSQAQANTPPSTLKRGRSESDNGDERTPKVPRRGTARSSPNSKVKGAIINEYDDGTRDWQAPFGNKDIYRAVPYHLVRDQLVQYAAQDGAYPHERRQGRQQGDVTAYFAPHHNISNNPTTWPDVVFQYHALDRDCTPRVKDILTINDMIVLNDRSDPMLHRPNVPLAISSKFEPYLAEACYRQEIDLAWFELHDRMIPGIGDRGIEGEQRRWRDNWGLATWAPHGESWRKQAVHDSRLGGANWQANSIRGLGQVSASEAQERAIATVSIEGHTKGKRGFKALTAIEKEASIVEDKVAKIEGFKEEYRAYPRLIQSDIRLISQHRPGYSTQWGNIPAISESRARTKPPKSRPVNNYGTQVKEALVAGRFYNINLPWPPSIKSASAPIDDFRQSRGDDRQQGMSSNMNVGDMGDQQELESQQFGGQEHFHGLQNFQTQQQFIDHQRFWCHRASQYLAPWSYPPGDARLSAFNEFRAAPSAQQHRHQINVATNPLSYSYGLLPKQRLPAGRQQGFAQRYMNQAFTPPLFTEEDFSHSFDFGFDNGAPINEAQDVRDPTNSTAAADFAWPKGLPKEGTSIDEVDFSFLDAPYTLDANGEVVPILCPAVSVDDGLAVPDLQIVSPGSMVEDDNLHVEDVDLDQPATPTEHQSFHNALPVAKSDAPSWLAFTR